jgi:hypothetical protein
MANAFRKIEHGIEIASEDVLHSIEYPVKFLVAAERVITDAIREQPDIKAAVLDLVSKAELVIGDVTLAAAQRGFDLASDAKALADAEAFFGWFRSDFVPLVTKVYGELKEDVR